MKLKRITSFIICALLLVCLVPTGAAASDGPSLLSVDGVYASVTLVDLSGAEHTRTPVFSADVSVVCPAMEGIEYDRASNTLTLRDLGAASSALELVMMGSDFKIKLVGSSTLGAIRSSSMGWGGSVEFCGDGSLYVSSSDGPALLVEAAGTPDLVRVGSQLRLTLTSAGGSAIEVKNSSLSQGAIVFDTLSPDAVEYDLSHQLTASTDGGAELPLYMRSGTDGLWGVEESVDYESESIVYNVYLLGERGEDGLYAAELVEEGLPGIYADFVPAMSAHDHILCARGSDFAVSSVSFARFTVNDITTDPNGSVSVSAASVSRGGSAVVSTVPAPGYKTDRLLIDGAEVALTDGTYTIWGMSSDHTAEAFFTEAQAASVTVTAPQDTALTVPAPGEEELVSAPISVSVRDADGASVGADIIWSVSPETAGVSVGTDGRVRVKASAADSVGSEPLALTVTASVAGSEYSGSVEFSLSRAERRACSVEILRGGERVESDDITVPAESETSVEYTPLVLDQYGEAMDADCLWSASGVPAGVETSDGRVTVSSECELRAAIKLTLSSGELSTDITVNILLNDGDAQPPAAPDESAPVDAGAGTDGDTSTGTGGDTATGTGGDTATGTDSDASTGTGGDTSTGTGGDTATATDGNTATGTDGDTPAGTDGDTPAAVPVIIWPNAEIKQSQTYGISWDELVSLSGGSAKLGDGEIEGAFALEHESELPNVSDSFSVVFLSADGQYRAESPLISVTLERRPLGDGTVSVRPSSVNYSGAAQTPGVAISCDGRELREGEDFRIVSYADNIEPGTASVTVEGIGNYSGSATALFTINRVPGAELAEFVSPRLPEDESIEPTVTVRSGSTLLEQGKDYDVSFSYDIASKTGKAVITLKGNYSGTIEKSFDLPNYLVVEGAGSSWSKSSVVPMGFRANGALGKFVELTVDGRRVDPSLYTVESGSTIAKISPEFLKTLTDGKHIVGFVYKDGKALAIFTITGASRKGVATGDGNDAALWLSFAGLCVPTACAALCALKGKKKRA